MSAATLPVRRTEAGLALLGVLALPPVAAWLEGHMLGHMLVQIPLLVVAGHLLGPAVARHWPRCLRGGNRGGIAGILLASFTLSFWMLPRSLDAALGDPLMEAAKFLSLPLLAGVPLALSWPRLHPVARGFVWANLISMLAVMGWLYLAAPVRLCNSYLVDQQTLLGWVLLLLTALTTLAWAAGVFFGGTKMTDNGAECRGHFRSPPVESS